MKQDIQMKDICAASILNIDTNNMTCVYSIVGHVEANNFIDMNNKSYPIYNPDKKDYKINNVEANCYKFYFPNDTSEINIFVARALMAKLEKERDRESRTLEFMDTYQGECEISWSKGSPTYNRK